MLALKAGAIEVRLNGLASNWLGPLGAVVKDYLCWHDPSTGFSCSNHGSYAFYGGGCGANPLMSSLLEVADASRSPFW